MTGSGAGWSDAASAGSSSAEPVVDDPDVRAAVYDAIPPLEQKLDSERNGVAVVIDLDRVTGGAVDMTRA